MPAGRAVPCRREAAGLANGVSIVFHTYVISANSRQVDFDRARLLMDRDLLRSTIKAMNTERMRSPRWDAKYDVQWIWEHYCSHHIDKYGQPFRPDADPMWDS